MREKSPQGTNTECTDLLDYSPPSDLPFAVCRGGLHKGVGTGSLFLVCL